MEISNLTLKLIILLTPGILAATIYKRLTVRHKERTDFMFVMLSIMFGMFSYLGLQTILFLYSAGYNLFSKEKVEGEILKAFNDISNGDIIPYGEVIWASLCAILIAFIAVKVDHYKWVNKLAEKLKVSNKYGDENLYSKWLNQETTTWIYVRDIPNCLTYCGWLCSFSETTDFKEMVLRDVSVLTYPESEDLYEVSEVYLCLPNDNVKIELAIKK